MEFPLLEACLPVYSFVDIDTIMIGKDIEASMPAPSISLLIVKVTRRNCFLSYILYIVVKKITVLPEYTSSFTLASSINMFFIEKIHNIKMEFPLLEDECCNNENERE